MDRIIKWVIFTKQWVNSQNNGYIHKTMGRFTKQWVGSHKNATTAYS